MRRWIKDFGEKGPCKEDLGSFIEYLGKVVKDEKDLDRAVKVLIWFQRIVDEFADEDERFAKHTWKQSSVRANHEINSLMMTEKGISLGEVTRGIVLRQRYTI
ncbi:hypothetical protein PSPO01_16604 [Paraphaeosphaeria sporulosa]